MDCEFPIKITVTNFGNKNQTPNLRATAWRAGITNLDRLPRSGIIMGSVVTFRHKHWIAYHVPTGCRMVMFH
uniref:Uncharacterized protein n=1 Tax=Solanum tuberosum TaxID=4113 RepID=M1AVL6_SOLTU